MYHFIVQNILCLYLVSWSNTMIKMQNHLDIEANVVYFE